MCPPGKNSTGGTSFFVPPVKIPRGDIFLCPPTVKIQRGISFCVPLVKIPRGWGTFLCPLLKSKVGIFCVSLKIQRMWVFLCMPLSKYEREHSLVSPHMKTQGVHSLVFSIENTTRGGHFLLCSPENSTGQKLFHIKFLFCLPSV